MSETHALSHVEICENDKGEWWFRAIAGNGEIVATSEMYTRQASALDEAKRLWPDVPISDAPVER